MCSRVSGRLCPVASLHHYIKNKAVIDRRLRPFVATSLPLHFFLIFFCLVTHVSLLCLCVKGGQHWWANAFTGSLPLYYLLLIFYFVMYLANKFLSLSLFRVAIYAGTLRANMMSWIFNTRPLWPSRPRPRRPKCRPVSESPLARNGYSYAPFTA